MHDKKWIHAVPMALNKQLRDAVPFRGVEKPASTHKIPVQVF
jgi:hypothetical protein